MAALVVAPSTSADLLFAADALSSSRLFERVFTASLTVPEISHENVVDALAAHGVAGPNCRDCEAGRTPLFSTVRLDNPAFTRALLECGADAAAADDAGVTVLHVAACGARAETLTLLLDHGAEVDARAGVHGWTALHEAAAAGWMDGCSVLMARGADISLTTNEGSDAACLAQVSGHDDLAKLLRSAARRAG